MIRQNWAGKWQLCNFADSISNVCHAVVFPVNWGTAQDSQRFRMKNNERLANLALAGMISSVSLSLWGLRSRDN